MSVVIKHTKEDITKFRNEICSSCRCLEICQSTFESMDEHVQYCPKFFNFMIGYKSFIQEQIEWERDHPEEVEERRKKNLELAKTIKSQKPKSPKRKSSH